MADLLHIEEPSRPRLPPPQWAAFLELGFRPLYLGGAAWAGVAIALWVGAPQWLQGRMGGVLWHAHEMLWGFIATIAVGFLLTAGSNWTGINPLRGRALGALSALWLLARLAFLVPGDAAFALATGAEMCFFAWAGGALARAVVLSRNRRNYGVPALLLALGAADALYLQSAWQGDYALLIQRFNAGLLCMAAIALLIARRVIPFFAMRAITGLAIPMHTRSGHWQLAATLMGVAGGLLGLPWAAAAGLAVAGAIALWQVLAWKPWAVRGVALLWILYLGYALLGVGLLVAAAHAAGGVARAAWPVHLVAVGGFSVLIIGMLTRTALGHLGQPLRTDRSMVAAYVAVLAAAGLRLLALLPVGWAPHALQLSACAWILAFALYLWRFAPLLVRPRPGQASTIPLKRAR